MYYQIYDTQTGRTLMTCPDAQSAHNILKTMNQPELEIRQILKTDHPLARK